MYKRQDKFHSPRASFTSFLFSILNILSPIIPIQEKDVQDTLKKLEEVSKIIKPGISTEEIDKVCYTYINDHKAYSAPLFYRGFPKSCCTSPNHVVCHGIPSDKILKDGDIVNVDVTALKDGWHGDTSRMFKVGDISIKAKKLINTTYEAMIKAINIVKDGIHLGDIGSVIQQHVETEGFSVVQDLSLIHI